MKKLNELDTNDLISQYGEDAVREALEKIDEMDRLLGYHLKMFSSPNAKEHNKRFQRHIDLMSNENL